MKRFSEQLHKEAEKAIKLQSAEKQELRERLVSYMEYHPLPAEMKQAAERTDSVRTILNTEKVATVHFPFSALFKSSAVAAVLLLVVVPLMAEKAVPGDPLYAVKVQTEELRSTLTFSGFEKVEWETERLNRRIAEARLLASEGRLTEEVEAEVAEAVREHTESAQREIAAMRSEDADEAEIASIALDTTLEVQSTSLKGEQTAATDQNDMETKVSLIANALDESRAQVEPRSASSTPSYDKLMARLEQNTTRIVELRNTLLEVAPESDLVEIDRRIADQARLIEEAMLLHENDDEASRELLVDVLQRTQKLIVFMTEIEVSATIDIEEIVPIVLTDDEEQAQMRAWKLEVDTKIELLMRMAAEVKDEAVLEKVELATDSAAGHLFAISATNTTYSVYEAGIADALAVLNDVLLMLEKEGHVPVTPIQPIDQTEDEQATSTVEMTDVDTEETTEEVATSTAVVSEGFESEVVDREGEPQEQELEGEEGVLIVPELGTEEGVAELVDTEI